MKNFLKVFVESIDMIESLKIDHQKLSNRFNDLKDIDLKYLNAVSAKKSVNENTIFQDLRCKITKFYFILFSISIDGRTGCDQTSYKS